MSRRAKQKAEIGLKDLHYDLLKEVYQKLPIHEQVRFGLTSHALNNVHSVEFQNLVTRGVDQMPKLRLLQEYYSRRLVNDAFTAERRARYPADDYRSQKYLSGDTIEDIIREGAVNRRLRPPLYYRSFALIKRRMDYSGVVTGGSDLSKKQGQFTTMHAKPVDIGRRVDQSLYGSDIPQRVLKPALPRTAGGEYQPDSNTAIRFKRGDLSASDTMQLMRQEYNWI
jgi:hypothetical protein